jgi:hypothetical protein
LGYVKSLHPKLTDLDAFRSLNMAASIGQLRDYEQVHYPKWLATVRSRFENLAENLHAVWKTRDLLITLSCTGGVPASSVIVRLRAKGKVVLRLPGEKSRKESQDRLKLPDPPELISFRNIPRNVFNLGLLSPESPKLQRDKNKLYAESDMAESVDVWEFSCEEFMHHNSHEILFALAPKDYSGENARGVIECEIQGTNIREPVVQSIPVRFTFVEKDALPVAEDLLKGRIFKGD